MLWSRQPAAARGKRGGGGALLGVTDAQVVEEDKVARTPIEPNSEVFGTFRKGLEVVGADRGAIGVGGVEPTTTTEGIVKNTGATLRMSPKWG